MMKKNLLATGIALAALTGLMTGCEEKNEGRELVENAYLLATVTADGSQRLVAVDLSKPDEAVRAAFISGLGAATTTAPVLDAEYLLDIDYRNAEGTIYGLTNRGRLYVVSTSGIATLVSVLSADAADSTSPFTGLAANVKYTIDFNPVVDRLRVIGSDGSNLRVDVLTGETITDTPISPSTQTLTAAAYTDTLTGTGARATSLYVIDAKTDQLFLQDANAGTLTAQASLGIGASADNSSSGYDIDPATGTGYALLVKGGKTGLYRIDHSASSNAASLLAGTLPGNVRYDGLTVTTNANPSVLALSSANQLYSFTAQKPGTLGPALAITLPPSGPAGETLVNIDARQADRKLYGLTSANRLVSIDLATGATTLASTLNPAPSGTSLAIDFDPLIPASGSSRLRVISNTGSNGLANVASGAITAGGNTSSGSTVAAAAYSRNYRATPADTTGGTAPTPGTSLYVIDTTRNVLAAQANNSSDATLDTGLVVSIAPLGFTPLGPVGFDISGRFDQNALLAARTSATGPLTLYRVSLAFGSANAATAVGQIGGSSANNLVDIAIRY